MNSVFSAFKSNKGNPVALSPTSNSVSEANKRNHAMGKKTLNLNETNNYEKLRHIREKMSNLLMDDDEINLRKLPAIPNTPMDADECESIQKFGGDFDCVDSVAPTNNFNGYTNGNLSSSSSSSSLNTISLASIKKHYNQDNSENYASENNLLSKCCNDTGPMSNSNEVSNLNANDVNSSASATNLVSINSMPLSDAIDASKSASSIFNKQPNSSNLSNTNRNRPRLSFSNVSNGTSINQQHQPAVHGRNNANGLPTGRTRLSTHQRNLSLDFRSMGILLPPVSQVTNTRINMTQHHRNRSLDSALQRIPEVEVSSPSAEVENTLSTTSVTNQTVCPATSNDSKVETSAITKVTENCKNKSDKTLQQPQPQVTQMSSNSEVNQRSKISRRDTLASKDSESKKREDLTSLGSDDSGIICGSEADQQSLNNRRSHESLDSGENDQSESEECIELLETTSMDEDYKVLQSDLSFYQPSPSATKKKKVPSTTADDQLDAINDKKLRYRELNMNKAAILKEKYNQTICVPIDYEELPEISAEIKDEAKELTKDTHVKDPVMFKSFFFKNAIFRTAQSIIENHEKKNGKNRDQMIASCSSGETTTPQPTKKRDFLLKSRMKNQNHTMTTSSSAENTTLTEKPKSCISKSSSTNSLSTMKVPGTAQCMVKEPIKPQIKTERGQSGLLRFFESPVFNIHFAVHYLFYSKEPGVLSFIGNKIFSFPNSEVDLYIPQLVLMYIQIDELADVLDPYLVYRCRQSADFSLKCSWLLEAYNFNMEGYVSTTQKFKHLMLLRELYPKRERRNRVKEVQAMSPISPFKKTHYRSHSDATGMLCNFKKPVIPPVKLSLGDLSSGRAFDNGCLCFETQRGAVNDLLGQQTVCSCGAPKLASEKEFLKALIDIGKMLTSLPTKIEKTSRLRVLLNLINKNLPARVWLPLNSDIPHHVVRITEEKTAVLNSKDKTPYIIYVEVVEVADIYTSPVIPKMMPTLRHTKSDEHLDQLGDSAEEVKKESEKGFVQSRTVSNFDVFNEEEIWSQEDDEITAQYLRLHRKVERDAVSQLSLESCDSSNKEIGVPHVFNIGDVRLRHCKNLNSENTKPFRNDPDDPSAAALKEPWHEKERQIRESSPYGYLQNWRLLSAIVKSGDDLRQELMATQLLQMFKQIWDEENIDLWVRPYQIVCLSNDSGLIEPILNTVSLHQIKKNSNKSLREYFVDEFGGEMTPNFKQAQKNFMQSCAAYCLISYLLQVKDRHNGNILLHSDGHLIHIDFGFILSISPKNLGFEQSPFKLTPEFLDIMDGPESDLYNDFKRLLLAGLKAARKQQDRIVNIVEIMRSSSQLPCFKNGCSATVRNLRNRFHMNLTEQELDRKIDQLIQDSLNSLSTKLYDGYQYLTNGIL